MPLLTESETHRHGFTVTSRIRTALVNSPIGEKEDGQLVIPKTYVTKKGALVLFSAPDDVKLDLSEKDKRFLKRKLLRNRTGGIEDKFGTLTRFTKSVLAFGDDVSNEWWNLSTIFFAQKLRNPLFIYICKCIVLTGK